MPLSNNKTGYGSVAKFLHWLIFLLVLIMLPLGYFMQDIADKSLQGQVINVHKLIGLSILVLMILRGLWALSNVKPALHHLPTWQRLGERAVHWLIYIALITMPIVGWIGSSAAGYYPHLGSLRFALPVPRSKEIDDVSFSIHNTLAIVIIVLISIHILAALYHYFVKKDNVLQRMLPVKN